MKLLGIDVGATKVAAGIVDTESGEILERRRVPTARDGRTVLDDCLGLARELEAPGGGVGIGICELVSPEGRVTSAASVDWRGLDLDEAFGGLAPVTVESDVRAAAAAEARHGAGRGESSMLFVGVGSGVSHTLVVDGRPLVGAHGEAIIFGAPPAEEVGSGHALARLAGAASAEEVLANPASGEVVEAGARRVGEVLATLANAMDPALVVIGGGLGSERRYFALIAERARALAHAASLRIEPAALGPDAGVIGAALARARMD
jgi:glucokinase